MKRKKLLGLLLTISMVFPIFSATTITTNAAVSITAPTPEGSWNSPKRLMYPGYTHWMNFADMSAYWGTGLDMTQHVWSDFADQGDMASRVYVELDKEMQASSTAGGKAGYIQGLFKTDDANYYRNLLWFGTFQGARIDYASYGTKADNKITYTVFPGAYVATALIISDYWMNVIGGENSTLHQQYKFQTSPDNATWADVPADQVNLFWEHGDNTGTKPVNAYATCIASMKIPTTDMYYRIISPFFAGMSYDATAVGPTKVSLTSMADGATGDATVSRYYAPVSKENRILDFDVWTSKAKIKTIDPITVNTLSGYITLDSANGSYKYFTSGDSEITDINTVLVNGMKIKVYDTNNILMLTYTIQYTAPNTVTISPNAPRKALNPGVVDTTSFDPIPGGNIDWDNYSDYATGYQAAKFLSSIEKGLRYFGTFFGVVNSGAYRAWQPAEGIGVTYRVVPESYMSTSLLLHTSIVTEDGTTIGSEAFIKAAARKYRMLTSPDGVNWTVYDLKDSDIDLDHGQPGWPSSFSTSDPTTSPSAFISVRACMKIPAGHRYYMVEFPTYYGADLCYIGSSKASLTDMRNGATGDETVAWYALPEVVSNDVANCIMNEATGMMVVKADGAMTLQQIIEKLLLTQAGVKFYDASLNEITDLSTNVQSGMIMKTFKTGETTPLVSFTIDAQIVLPPEDPRIEVGDATKITIDETNKKLVLTNNSMTLQNVLDALVLKGEVVVIFTDKDGNELTDMSAMAQKGMFVQLYTSVFLGEYEIDIATAGEVIPTVTSPVSEQAPATGDNSTPGILIILTIILAGSITILTRRKIPSK